MILEVFAVVFGIVIFFLLYIFLFRCQQIASFRINYLREESDFLMRTMWIDDKGGVFARFDALPSFDSMVWKFWIPVQKFYQPLSEFYDLSKVKDIYTEAEISMLKYLVDYAKKDLYSFKEKDNDNYYRC